MTILADWQIAELLPELLPVAQQRDVSLINPASLDLRIGREVRVEIGVNEWREFRTSGWLHAKPYEPVSVQEFDSFKHDQNNPESGGFLLAPGQFALVSVFEHIRIPNGFAMELRLKSSVARRGFNHSLAFWIDPGWDGVLTMEIQNLLRFTALEVREGARFAQAIVHKLEPSERPYSGKYKGARSVEGEK